MNVKWIGPKSVHPDLGDLEHGKTYDVPEDLAKAWVAQGVADPETAETHRLTRGTRREKE